MSYIAGIYHIKQRALDTTLRNTRLKASEILKQESITTRCFLCVRNSDKYKLHAH